MGRADDAAKTCAPRITSIAIVDDDFAPIALDGTGCPDAQAVSARLSSLDVEEEGDLAERGFTATEARSDPAGVVEALTDPQVPLGAGFAGLSETWSELGERIEARRNVRRLALDLRSACAGAHVVEYPSDADPDDLAAYDVIFLDCFLVRGSDDTEPAVGLASRLGESSARVADQQLVLMSSSERARAVRRQFRSRAGVDGAAFLFAAKAELDHRWKVGAHLRMLENARAQARRLAEYVRAVKESARAAADELCGLLDCLDLSDFAHLQRLALHEDGHPLGEYLSWLLSSHLRALAFEGSVRNEECAVDSLAFDDALVSPGRLSRLITRFHHSAVFVGGRGPLGPHPRADGGEGSVVPLVRLGDVFLTEGPNDAVAVLSADCDLSFAPGGARHTPKSKNVLLVPGTPQLMRSGASADPEGSTQGLEHNSELFRVNWSFGEYETVPLEKLAAHLEELGFDIQRYLRLRPLYALQLQRAFAAYVFRIGSPVPPPVSLKLEGEIVRFRPIGDRGATEELYHQFLDDDLSASYFRGRLRIRITPVMAGRLYSAVEVLRVEMNGHLASLEGGEQENFRRKIEAIDRLSLPRFRGHDIL